jgi:myo-inositol-1(or 4)-monophosphatase
LPDGEGEDLHGAGTGVAGARSTGPHAADLALLAAAAREAGTMAMGYFGRSPEVWTKGDSSPVSEADLAVDRFLGEHLRAARPDYGWLSEETADGSARLDRRRLFIVDPIDGTRAFIRGDEDWTVSLAIVEDGRPIAAAVLCPPRDELFLAALGGGARLNGAPVAVTGSTALAGSRMAGPKGFVRHAVFAQAGVEHVPLVHSLAYRIALVAAGRLDAAAASSKACDWDLAAADLLVHEAGGRLVDLEGRAVCYNRPTVRHPPLVAATPALLGPISALLAAAIGERVGHG